MAQGRVPSPKWKKIGEKYLFSSYLKKKRDGPRQGTFVENMNFQQNLE